MPKNQIIGVADAATPVAAANYAASQCPEENGLVPFFAELRITITASANYQPGAVTVTVPAKTYLYASHVKCVTAGTITTGDAITVGVSIDGGTTMNYALAEFDEADLDAIDDEAYSYAGIELTPTAMPVNATGGIGVFVDTAGTLALFPTNSSAVVAGTLDTGDYAVRVWGYTFQKFADQ